MYIGYMDILMDMFIEGADRNENLETNEGPGFRHISTHGMGMESSQHQYSWHVMNDAIARTK